MLLHNGQQVGAPVGRAVGLGNLNADGSPDAFVATFGGIGYPDEVWLNDGTGQFGDSGQQLGNEAGTGVLLGDLDGDSDLDAFVLNSGPRRPSRVSLYLVIPPDLMRCSILSQPWVSPPLKGWAEPTPSGRAGGFVMISFRGSSKRASQSSWVRGTVNGPSSDVLLA